MAGAVLACRGCLGCFLWSTLDWPFLFSSVLYLSYFWLTLYGMTFLKSRILDDIVTHPCFHASSSIGSPKD